MGWKNAFHCEIDPFCNRILNYWFPNAQSYTDIITTDFKCWNGKIDVLTGGFPCFIAGTKVLTASGLKNIEDIRIGDPVLTKEGDFQPCNAVMKSRKRSFTCLRAQGLYAPLVTTDNHPFYVRDEWGRYGWKEAGKLFKGERVGYRCVDGDDFSYTEDF